MYNQYPRMILTVRATILWYNIHMSRKEVTWKKKSYVTK